MRPYCLSLSLDFDAVEGTGQHRHPHHQLKKRATVRHRRPPPRRSEAQCAMPRIATGVRQLQSVPQSRSAYGAQQYSRELATRHLLSIHAPTTCTHTCDSMVPHLATTGIRMRITVT